MGRGPEWVRAISSCPDSERALSWRFMSSSAPASKGLPSRPGPPCSITPNRFAACCAATDARAGACLSCGWCCGPCLGTTPGSREDRALIRAAVSVCQEGVRHLDRVAGQAGRPRLHRHAPHQRPAGRLGQGARLRIDSPCQYRAHGSQSVKGQSQDDASRRAAHWPCMCQSVSSVLNRLVKVPGRPSWHLAMMQAG